MTPSTTMLTQLTMASFYYQQYSTVSTTADIVQGHANVYIISHFLFIAPNVSLKKNKQNGLDFFVFIYLGEELRINQI